MSSEQRVRVLLDPDGFMIRAGDPGYSHPDIDREIGEVIREGGSLTTVPYEDYLKLTWIYDKPKNTAP